MNDDLHDRLRALGDHIDVERALSDPGSPTSTDHPTRWWALAAAAALVIGGIMGITVWRSNRADDVSTPATVAPPTTSVGLPATSQPNSTATPNSTNPTTPVAPRGSAAIVLRADGTPSSTDIDGTVQRINEFIGALSVSGRAVARAGQKLEIELDLTNLTESDVAVVTRWLEAIGRDVHFRPVLTSCGPSIHIDLPHWPPLAADTATLKVVGRSDDYACTVGPSQATQVIFDSGGTFRGSQPDQASTWTLESPLRSGDAGEAVFNRLATACFQRDATCPTGQIAVEIDGQLLSVASVQTPTFTGSLMLSGTASLIDEYGLQYVFSRQDPRSFKVTVVSSNWTP